MHINSWSHFHYNTLQIHFDVNLGNILLLYCASTMLSQLLSTFMHSSQATFGSTCVILCLAVTQMKSVLVLVNYLCMSFVSYFIVHYFNNIIDHDEG